MSHQLDLLMTAVTALSTKVDQQSNQIAELTLLVKENSVQIAELNKKTQENSDQIAELRAMVQENTNQIAELNKKVEKNTAQIGELNTKVEKNSAQIGELNSKVEKNSVQITDLYQHYAKLMSYLQEWRQEVDCKFEEQWARTERELHDLRKRIDSIQEQTAKNAELMPLVLDSNHELKAHRQVFVVVYAAVGEQLKIV